MKSKIQNTTVQLYFVSVVYCFLAPTYKDKSLASITYLAINHVLKPKGEKNRGEIFPSVKAIRASLNEVLWRILLGHVVCPLISDWLMLLQTQRPLYKRCYWVWVKCSELNRWRYGMAIYCTSIFIMLVGILFTAWQWQSWNKMLWEKEKSRLSTCLPVLLVRFFQIIDCSGWFLKIDYGLVE